MPKTLTLADRATDALWDARNDAEMEPIGAGFRIVHFDTVERTWKTTSEMHYNEARKARAKILAAKALERMGADPVKAAAVTSLLPHSRAARLVETACPLLGITQPRRKAA